MTELNAGRELDALVAEKVMGWTDTSLNTRTINSFVTHFTPHGKPPQPPPNSLDFYTQIPRYSTDIAAAWEVVERLRDSRELSMSDFGSEWMARLSPYHVDELGLRLYRWVSDCTVYAENPAAAICLAALKAVSSSDD